MPPKKEKKKKEPIVIDGVDTTDMTREQLEQFTLRVKEELDREREERNYFQIERDKLRTYWDISRNQLEELRSEIRNKEREREEGAEIAEQAAATHTQCVKHLVYEHAGEKCALWADVQAKLQQAHVHHSQQLLEINRDKRELRAQLQEQDIAAQEELRKLKMVHHEELSTSREEFEVKCRELEAAAERRLIKTTAEAEAARRADLAELEERKSQQITALVNAHEAAFADLKDYYNDITLNNLGLISSLKSQVEEMQRLKERAEVARSDALAAKRALVEPLENALLDAVELKRRAHNADHDKAALATKTKVLAAMEKRFEGIKWEYEVLQQRFDNVKKERDELQERFAAAVLGLQQRAALKGALLEQHLQRVYDGDHNKWQSS